MVGGPGQSQPCAADTGDRLAVTVALAAFGLGSAGLVWVGIMIRACLMGLA